MADKSNVAPIKGKNAGSADWVCSGHVISMTVNKIKLQYIINSVGIRQDFRNHTPSAIISCKGLSHSNKILGEVASWLLMKTRKAIRHPANPSNANQIEYMVRIIIFRRHCIQHTTTIIRKNIEQHTIGVALQ